MKYKISTDKVIIDHVMNTPNKEVHHFNNAGMVFPGVVTCADIKNRTLTLQFKDGCKYVSSFDSISIPDE